MKLLIANGYVIDPAQQLNTGGRGVLIENGRAYIQAGAGIVADSEPAAEEAETRAKARALLRAVELAGGELSR